MVRVRVRYSPQSIRVRVRVRHSPHSIRVRVRVTVRYLPLPPDFGTRHSEVVLRGIVRLCYVFQVETEMAFLRSSLTTASTETRGRGRDT